MLVPDISIWPSGSASLYSKGFHVQPIFRPRILQTADALSSLRVQRELPGTRRLRGISRTALHACARSSQGVSCVIVVAPQPVGTASAQIRWSITLERAAGQKTLCQ